MREGSDKIYGSLSEINVAEDRTETTKTKDNKRKKNKGRKKGQKELERNASCVEAKHSVARRSAGKTPSRPRPSHADAVEPGGTLPGVSEKHNLCSFL